MSTTTKKITAGLKNVWDSSVTGLRTAYNSSHFWAAWGGIALGIGAAEIKHPSDLVIDLFAAGYSFALSHSAAEKKERARLQELAQYQQDALRIGFKNGFKAGGLAKAERSSTLPEVASRGTDLTAEPGSRN